jgi:hypothetical protein
MSTRRSKTTTQAQTTKTLIADVGEALLSDDSNSIHRAVLRVIDKHSQYWELVQDLIRCVFEAGVEASAGNERTLIEDLAARRETLLGYGVETSDELDKATLASQSTLKLTISTALRVEETKRERIFAKGGPIRTGCCDERVARLVSLVRAWRSHTHLLDQIKGI